jgi:hypothetical protein
MRKSFFALTGKQLLSTKILPKLLITMLIVIQFTTYGNDNFVLIRDGKAEVAIKTTGKENAKFDRAVKLFIEQMEKVSAVKIPVVSSPSGKKIVWHKNDAFSLDKHNDFIISFPDAETMQIEATEFSIQWAFNYIFEQSADARWLFPGEYGLAYKARKEYSLPRKTVKNNVPFPLLRWMWWLPESLTEQWEFRPNGVRNNHQLYVAAFPPAKYQRGWPQEIMPLINGKRLRKPPSLARHWQPCFSNPKTAKEAIKNIFEYLKKHPRETNISLGINDNGGFCQCTECFKANNNFRGYDKSEVYYKWVNKVANAVCEKYPHIYFGLIAYRETIKPPSFRLHPHIVPFITLDIFAMNDPKVNAKHRKLIIDWKNKVDNIGVWDYCWGYQYVLPRVYFRLHAQTLKFIHTNNCRAYFAENSFVSPMDGPKMYLISRLIRDIDTDVDATLNDWYVRCAGRAAAPYLKAYYDRCEAFFASSAMKKTPWYSSRNAVYMSYYEDSWKNALRSGELAKFRAPLEKALELASSHDEKERVNIIFDSFKFAEAKLKLTGSEYISPSGSLKSAWDAVKMLKEMKEMPKYIKQYREISEKYRKNSLSKYYLKVGIIKPKDDSCELLIRQLLYVTPFLSNKHVSQRLAELAKNQLFPEMFRKTAGLLANDAESEDNLLTNSGFENKTAKNEFVLTKGNWKRSRNKKYSGSYSLCLTPGKESLLYFDKPAVIGASYLAVFKVYMQELNPEAYIHPYAWPMHGKTLLHWEPVSKRPLASNTWQTFSALGTLHPKWKATNGIRLGIRLGNFEPGQKVFIDDVKLIRIK